MKNQIICIIGVVCIVFVFALIYFSYIYQPKDSLGYKSEYLKTVQTQFLSTEKYDIHYLQQGSGEPLILLHGGGVWLYSYKDNIPALAKNYLVYALDMPGHGYTRLKVKNPSYDLDMYNDFLKDFMDAKGIQKASLVGNSWGGGWALYFAQKYPDRVRKLVLIDAAGYELKEVMEWEAFKYPLIGEILSKMITPNVMKSGLAKALYDKTKISESKVKENYTPMTYKENRKAQYLATRRLDWKKTRNNLSKVHCKTLILWGKNDEYYNYKTAYRFKEGIKDAEVILLDNCGHISHEEYPEKVNSIIDAFIGNK